jgi:hypothetical protein
MEILFAQRNKLNEYGVGLRDVYDDFRQALRYSGFQLTETRDRKTRAQEQRRLGELADALGNVPGAIAFYELALTSWPQIGCRRRLDQLRLLAHSSKPRHGE